MQDCAHGQCAFATKHHGESPGSGAWQSFQQQCACRDRLARLRAVTAAVARWTAAGLRESRVAARNPTSALPPQGESIAGDRKRQSCASVWSLIASAD